MKWWENNDLQLWSFLMTIILSIFLWQTLTEKWRHDTCFVKYKYNATTNVNYIHYGYCGEEQ